MRRINREFRLRWLALFAGLLLAPVLAARGADAPRDDAAAFQAQYPAAAAKLEAAYAHCRIAGTEVFHYQRGEGEAMREYQFDLLRSGDATRMVCHTLQSTDDRWPIGSITIDGGTPALHFSCYKLPADEDFTFDSIGRDKNPAVTPFTMMPAFTAYCIDSSTVPELLHVADTRITSVGAAQLDGMPAIEVDTETPFRQRHVIRQHIFFQPGTWALLGCTSESYLITIQLRVAYEPNLDQGIPRIHSIERYEERSTKPGKKLQERRYDISHIEFVALPQEQFTPAALKGLGVKNIPAVDSPDTATADSEAPVETAATQPPGIQTEASLAVPPSISPWLWGIALVMAATAIVFVYWTVRDRRSSFGP